MIPRTRNDRRPSTTSVNAGFQLRSCCCWEVCSSASAFFSIWASARKSVLARHGLMRSTSERVSYEYFTRDFRMRAPLVET